MNKRTIAIFILLTMLIGGVSYFIIFENEFEEKVGGPCSYVTTTYPLEIIGIDTVSDTEVDLRMALTMEEHRDTLSFYIEEGRYVAIDELNQFNLNVGSSLNYEVKYITEGACTPELYRVLLN